MSHMPIVVVAGTHGAALPAGRAAPCVCSGGATACVAVTAAARPAPVDTGL